MKFLVFGCNGMAGHMISIYLKEQGHDVTGFALSKSPYVKCIIGDAANLELVKETVKNGKYDTIINCIGLLNKFAEDNKADAIYLNSYFPHYLAQLTENTDTQVIYMSTDCVFSGVKGQYEEDDFRDGITFYDRTKALGEIENEKDLTMRQSIVGPDINQNGIGLLNWFMQQNEEINGYTRSIWTGQTTLQLAKTMEAAAKEKAHGLYNMVPDTWISKYDLLRLFNKYLRNDLLKIHPVDNVMVTDKSLKRTKFEFNYIIPEYEQMVIELAQWMKSHMYLYPRYCMK